MTLNIIERNPTLGLGMYFVLNYKHLCQILGIMWWSAQWRALCTKITEVNLSTEILEVNLFAFAYRLFHEDFSPICEKLIYLLLFR